MHKLPEITVNNGSNENLSHIPTYPIVISQISQHNEYETINKNNLIAPNQIQMIGQNIGEINGDTVPPPFFIAMNNAYNLKKSTNPTSIRSQELFCNTCNEIIISKIEKKTGEGTYVLCGLMCCFGCFLGCCLIPFFNQSCKDSIHYCPKCNNHLGSVDFLFRRL